MRARWSASVEAEYRRILSEHDATHAEHALNKLLLGDEMMTFGTLARELAAESSEWKPEPLKPLVKPTEIMARVRQGMSDSGLPIRRTTARVLNAIDKKAAKAEAAGLTLTWDKVVLAIYATARLDVQENQPADDPFA